MKKFNIKIVFLALIFIGYQAESQIGISAIAGFTPDSKAMLDVSSTSKGLLIPRMNTVQRTGIITPPASLMVYDTDLKSYWYFDGTDWKEIGAGSGGGVFAWNLLGNLGIDPSTQYIGTNDANAINFKTDNTQRMQIAKHGRIGVGMDASDNIQLFVKSTGNAYGINSELELPYVPSTVKHTYAINGQNNSRMDGNRYGGYFRSSSFSYGGTVSNYGVYAYAASSATNNTALYASTFETTTVDLAAHFDKGNVKVGNTLAIGKHPGLSNHLEVLKAPSKSGAFFDLPIIGKNNSVYIGKRDTDNDMIALEINSENTPSGRALEVHGRSTFYDKVGINTTTVPAAYSLAVNGFIIAEELRIQNMTGWPDYVFDKKYKLKPLTDLEDFIKKNKHLPEVPSAKTVENEGVAMGEMQKTLLKKIEELTLYIINQQMQIDVLKANIEKINQK